MPIIKSAIKRVKQEDKRRKRNLITARQYKSLVKQFETLITDGKKEEAKTLFPAMQKAIDMASKKNIIHKNNASNKKSMLSRMLKNA